MLASRAVWPDCVWLQGPRNRICYIGLRADTLGYGNRQGGVSAKLAWLTTSITSENAFTAGHMVHVSSVSSN